MLNRHTERGGVSVSKARPTREDERKRQTHIRAARKRDHRGGYHRYDAGSPHLRVGHGWAGSSMLLLPQLSDRKMTRILGGQRTHGLSDPMTVAAQSRVPPLSSRNLGRRQRSRKADTGRE